MLDAKSIDKKVNLCLNGINKRFSLIPTVYLELTYLEGSSVSESVHHPFNGTITPRYMNRRTKEDLLRKIFVPGATIQAGKTTMVCHDKSSHLMYRTFNYLTSAIFADVIFILS